MSISAMKKALEALDAYSWEQVDAARAALRQAIAEAEKREWVGLTDEELELINDCGDTDSLKFARAIEAKLKEKNT